ncbi:hypothetical protein [Argonema antarcticum]|uniref:hypothetical protein n=1 Tax=Argonema antarcticum TaxID=2942763 RepID=UPI0020123A42|nr:hypothetical protein [Argonema antarcticum]
MKSNFRNFLAMRTPLKLTASLLILLGLSFQAEAKILYTHQESASKLGISADGVNEILVSRETIIPRPRRSDLNDALRGFRTQTFRVSRSVDFTLNRDGMRHILQSHHPNYWDGSREQYQTFFDEDMDVRDIVGAIRKVVNENREIFNGVTANRQCQITGTLGILNRKNYVLGIKSGRLIGQFFPKHRNYRLTNPCR